MAKRYLIENLENKRRAPAVLYQKLKKFERGEHSSLQAANCRSWQYAWNYANHHKMGLVRVYRIQFYFQAETPEFSKSPFLSCKLVNV